MKSKEKDSEIDLTCCTSGIRHLVELWRLHRHTHPRLARRQALGEHVKKAFAPFIIRSRLYDLVACDEIIFYLELL